MKLDFHLRLEQSQKLIMTPQLKMAISMLQYSRMELREYIQQELLENPVLEMREEGEKENDDLTDEEKVEDDEFPWEEYLRDSNLDCSLPTFYPKDDPPPIDSYAREGRTLQDDLSEQLRLMSLPRAEYNIASYLVGNLDGNGYLRGNLDELAFSLGASEKELAAGLALVQGLEPPGVGARDIWECLLLQLKRINLVPPPLVEKIITHYLPAAADNRYRYIASRLGCEQEQVQSAIDFIRDHLNPKPGNIYGSGEETRYIIPDLTVEKVGKEYIITASDGGTPRLTISPFYQRLLRTGTDDEQLTSFVKGKMDSALWLIRSIEQRRLTLYRVATQIVKLQQAFLEQGIKHLKPLTLKEVASKLGIHESTVSRATSNKYIQTPRGLFPLKFFFSSGVTGAGGENYSSHSIKNYLQELVEREDSLKPFSDQQMAGILKGKGIVISRRTVAKYREEIGIPPSYRRRRI
ncbi:MAG: RNA polymerase factor sigma-54 [Firmicutes bacterium]|nr:RNA polymerase factor sigma-54 [Bacillota bacterium]